MLVLIPNRAAMGLERPDRRLARLARLGRIAGRHRRRVHVQVAVPHHLRFDRCDQPRHGLVEQFHQGDLVTARQMSAPPLSVLLQTVVRLVETKTLGGNMGEQTGMRPRRPKHLIRPGRVNRGTFGGADPQRPLVPRDIIISRHTGQHLDRLGFGRLHRLARFRAGPLRRTGIVHL